MSFIAINAIVGSAMLAVSLVAQVPPAQTKPTPETGTAITVVGCLKKWEPSMAARGGLQNPSKLEWVLTDLAPGTAASPALPNVLRYLVKAKDTTVMLEPHANHRVEVTGLVTGLANAATPSSPATPPANQQVLAPTLTISALKMVSTECL
jgi:hypothetical protein